MNLWSKNY